MEKSHLCLGLLAHVDAGKTTLSEALLYETGAKRNLGRVDHGDALLDTHTLERQRGITIFSKQALLATETLDITLIDTPGHVDFSAEAERSLSVLDCAVLLISGTDGVQAHTLTLWRLLKKYHVPTFLFVNKMDLPAVEERALLQQLQKELSPGCIPLNEEFIEQCALCREVLLETYLSTGALPRDSIRQLVAERQIFPCCFGSALRLEGILSLLEGLEEYAPRPIFSQEFSGRVYKISRDDQGNRLTWLKLTGGSLSLRAPICYVNQKGDSLTEKALQLRRYCGEKFTPVDTAYAGQTVAITGLSQSYIGMSLGAALPAPAPSLEPVMTYKVILPQGVDPRVALPKLQLLQEEEPLLHLSWEEDTIHVQIMGKVQLEILKSLAAQRFSLDIQLDDGRIFYKETILNTVEGVGHFEPLRHYAEVHLLLEPLPQGSGLVFASTCPTDILETHYQNLILTHMAEKTHRGVLTGSPITDMKITLLVGKAHLKHTEGGDFRQATYRAIRQGLMGAQSQLLEPWYRFTLTLPTESVGRAITDMRAMGGEFQSPENTGSFSTLTGTVPASELGDYAQLLAAYTQGRGRLQLTLSGYAPCHNTEKVLSQTGYDPQADLENTPDSVFCAHGAGFTVKWNEVPQYMHLESGLKSQTPPQVISRNLHLEDKTLEAIMEKQFGPQKTVLHRPSQNLPATEAITICAPKQKYLIVDGYNVIFAQPDLKSIAKEDLDAARRQLCDWLSSYAGYKKCRVVAVFDGYKVKGNPGERVHYHNIQVVYTKENETADAYIAALVTEIGNSYAINVATSDALVQLSSLRAGFVRVSARELLLELEQAHSEMQTHYEKK